VDWIGEQMEWMSRMILMYVLGFVSVWVAVALVSAAVAAFRHFTRNWDRAFEKELRASTTVEN
jgi:cytochrome c biogenesis protein CcdA